MMEADLGGFSGANDPTDRPTLAVNQLMDEEPRSI